MSKLELLVPLDGTEFSRRIEPEVRKVFPRDRWRIRLLHVAEAPVEFVTPGLEPALVGADFRLYMYGYASSAPGLHPVYDEDNLLEYRQSLQEQLQGEVELFREAGYEVDAAVHFGDPAEAIVSHAAEIGADVVAMATHHRTGLGRFFQASVARQVLHRIAVPALLLEVHERSEGDEGAVGNEQTRKADEATAGSDTATYGTTTNGRRDRQRTS